MVRIKLVAILLGPSGVGMVGLFTSSITWVMQLTGLGIGSSGVREIAKAHGSQDQSQIGKTVQVLRRACWLTGIAGWVVTVVLSRPLSIWVFESPNNAWLISALGATLLLTAITKGQKAIIQVTRRITDLAWMTVLASVLGTIVAVLIYWIWGAAGIVPVLIATAAINMIVTWWFAQRVDVPHVASLTWIETFREGKELTNLGVAFMWAALLASLLDMGIRALIAREISLEATGYYQAAWALSGMFANFILVAMGADFYPRLTAIADNHPLIKSTVNEQIEIGILIAIPGLLGTLALGPMLISVFYTAEFTVAATILPWFIFGIFFRVVTWPVGFAILAKGASRWFLFTQTVFYGTNMLLAWVLIPRYGLVGAGISFLATFAPATLLNLFVARHLTGFMWSRTVVQMLLCNLTLVAFAFLSSILLDPLWCTTVCFPMAIITSAFSLRGIASRVGAKHRIVRTLEKIPGVRLIIGT